MRKREAHHLREDLVVHKLWGDVINVTREIFQQADPDGPIWLVEQLDHRGDNVGFILFLIQLLPDLQQGCQHL